MKFASRIYSAAVPSVVLLSLAIAAVLVRNDYASNAKNLITLRRLVVARALLSSQWSDVFIQDEFQIPVQQTLAPKSFSRLKLPESQRIGPDRIFMRASRFLIGWIKVRDSSSNSWSMMLYQGSTPVPRSIQVPGTEGMIGYATFCIDGEYAPGFLLATGTLDTHASIWHVMDGYVAYVIDPLTKLPGPALTLKNIDDQIAEQLDWLGVSVPTNSPAVHTRAAIHLERSTTQVPVLGISLPMPGAMIGFVCASVLASVGFLVKCATKEPVPDLVEIPGKDIGKMAEIVAGLVVSLSLLATVLAPAVIAGAAAMAFLDWGFTPLLPWKSAAVALPGVLGMVCTIAGAMALLSPAKPPESARGRMNGHSELHLIARYLGRKPGAGN